MKRHNRQIREVTHCAQVKVAFFSKNQDRPKKATAGEREDLEGHQQRCDKICSSRQKYDSGGT